LVSGFCLFYVLSLRKFIVIYNIGKSHSLNCIFLGLAFPIKSIKFYIGEKYEDVTKFSHFTAVSFLLKLRFFAYINVVVLIKKHINFVFILFTLNRYKTLMYA
jgi:hypothetical protein